MHTKPSSVLPRTAKWSRSPEMRNQGRLQRASETNNQPDQTSSTAYAKRNEIKMGDIVLIIELINKNNLINNQSSRPGYLKGHNRT